MSAALYASTAVLAAVLAFSAARKLKASPPVVESYARVGVTAAQLPLLAGVITAGAIGLLAGWAWPGLGLAAAIGLVVYFCLALVAHARHNDLGAAVSPGVLLTLAIASTVMYALEL